MRPTDADALKTRVLGCLLGTAVGDATGLNREGLSPRRASRLFGDNITGPDLLFGRGLCSDDTEHTAMVARALAISAGCPDDFERVFARQLKVWLLTVPAGVGLATLRGCLKLLIGFPPSKSGVYRAGNGPAMRSALLGLYANSDDSLRELIRRATRPTHTDPRAEEGAYVVAKAAASGISDHDSAREFVAGLVAETSGDELRDLLDATVRSLEAGSPPAEFVRQRGWSRGVSGYVNQTVPTAMHCWAASPDDYVTAVTSAVSLGGDTDTVAAIVGGIVGANLGSTAIPTEWTARLAEWPRNVVWTERLADAVVTSREGTPTQPPPMQWAATLPRNAIFAGVVLALGFRRLLPPY
ncbi:MAG: ADP-ribosylglycohydrolase family protein [Planctomycetota bacterium]